MSDRTWAKGWRTVVICKDCETEIWCTNVGQTVKCKCEIPRSITEDHRSFSLGKIGKSYNIGIKLVEQPY